MIRRIWDFFDLQSPYLDQYISLFLGPEIFKCKGCTINWKEPGKNLTVKTVKKKQKHKSKGNVRTITKQVKNDSFFNFFDPPPISDDPEADVDPETQVIWKIKL